jgi:hypothetical protein
MPMIDRWIVIGGCPRSGTTLIGNALGAAEAAIVTPEAQFATEALAAVASGQLPPDPGRIIDYIAGHWRFRIWDEPLPATWPDFAGCQNGADLCSAILRHIVADFARRRGKPEARFWIDHTPEHLRAVPCMLTSDFDVTAVHVLRDGRGVASSMTAVDWGPNDIASLAQWWLARIAEGFAAERLLADRAVSVRFEDVLASPEAALGALCGALGLRYTEAMLTSRALHVVDYTRAQHRFVGRRPDPSRATAWMTDLSQRDQEVFESIAGHALSLLGYPRRFATPEAQGSIERLGTWLVHNPARRRWVRHARRRRRAELLGDR